MKKKALIIASCGVLSLSALVITNALTSSVKLAKADDAHSTHDTGSMKYIGFDWSDPTKDGYKPYYRCPSCCSTDPSTSRYSSKTDTTSVSVDDLKLSALTSLEKSSISGDAIVNADSDSYVNLDQVGKDKDGNRLVASNYVKDGKKNAIYFSRSRAIFDTQSSSSDESICSFSFASNLGEGKSLGSLSFSYRYLNYSTVKKNDSSDTSTTYASKLLFNYGDTSKTCVLDDSLNSDGEWHVLSLTTQEAVGEESLLDFSSLTFKFSDLQGCILISNLYFSEETKAEMDKRFGITPVLSEDKTSLTYGLYPQTHVSNEATIASLNGMSESEKLNGYYFLNGEYYAKATSNIPHTSSGFAYFDDKTYIFERTQYWFKCEAIKWNVLSSTDFDTVIHHSLVSTLLLDVHRYNESYSDKNDAGYYANNYGQSEMNSWLNGDFYDQAFRLDKSRLTNSYVDNSVSTAVADSRYDNPYCCDSFMKLVYLQSLADVKDINNLCSPSDWTKAAGVYYLYEENVGNYWTRSPSKDGSNLAYTVDPKGRMTPTGVNETDNGVRPCVSVLLPA